MGPRSTVCAWVAMNIAVSCALAVSAGAVTIDLVPVGNSGNANDTTGYGAVAATYWIGKHEVTIQPYTEFLDAVDPNGTNPFGLYNNLMGTEGNIRGIRYRSESGQLHSPAGSP